MKARFRLFKLRMVLSFGIALMVAGAIPLLYFAALLGWQFSVLSETGAWMALPAALPFAEYRSPMLAAGVCLLLAGTLVARRQKAAIALEKQRREDRLRRVRDYRRDASGMDPLASRREPFMSASEAKAEVELERALMSAAAEATRQSNEGARVVRAL